MIKNDISLLWIVAVIGMGFLISHLVNFTAEARTRKRRRKNHYPVSSKARRPMVKFSVRTN